MNEDKGMNDSEKLALVAELKQLALDGDWGAKLALNVFDPLMDIVKDYIKRKPDQETVNSFNGAMVENLAGMLLAWMSTQGFRDRQKIQEMLPVFLEVLRLKALSLKKAMKE